MKCTETFIRKVFGSMVKYKPSYAVFLDEDDDSFDIRELSNNITKSFPWPIGIEIRRLLSGSMEGLNRGRIDQIFKSFERTVQFISFVMLIQLLEHSIKEQVKIPLTFKNQFKSRFTTLTMGNYVWLIKEISAIMSTNGIKPFMAEIETAFTKNFFKSLDYWTPERNEIGHFQVNLSDEEIEVRCNEYLDKLGDLLSDIAFVIKYPLITVTEIQLIKSKRENVHYLHSMLMLNSSSSSFSGKNEDFLQFADTHSVLLIKSLKNVATEFLNLSPLIIDTHSEKMETREKLMKLKKDIYLYSKWDLRSNSLHYNGTEATEKPDMKLVSFYDQLLKDHEEIMKIFSTNED